MAFIDIIGSLAVLLKKTYLLFRLRLKHQKYLKTPRTFTDRTDDFYAFFEAINKRSATINVIGKKGVGKTTFLEMASDIINGVSEYYSLDKTRYRLPEKILAIYNDVSDNIGSENILREISLAIFRKEKQNIHEVCDMFNMLLIWKKTAVIIFDNINSESAHRDVEQLICGMEKSIKKNIVFVIGSTIPFTSYLREIVRIDLKPFDESSTLEYLKKHNRHELTGGDGNIASILSFTEGLPIYLKLIMNDSMNSSDFSPPSENIENYILRIIESLNSAPFELLKTINCLSLTKRIVPSSLIRKINSSGSQEEFRILERNSLIEEKSPSCYKLHDKIQAVFNSRFGDSLNDVHSKIGKMYEEMQLTKEAYLHYIAANEIECRIEGLFKLTVKEQNSENYTYLIHIGEISAARQKSGAEYSEMAKSVILLAYISGLLGMGNYPAANELFRKNNPVLFRDLSSNIGFELAFRKADLLHLENKYGDAVTHFNLLYMDSVKRNDMGAAARCAFSIAHSLRHMGNNLEEACRYYDKAVEYAEKSENPVVECRARIDKLKILALWNERSFLYDSEFSEIDDIIKRIPKEQNRACFLAFKRCQALIKDSMTEDPGSSGRELHEWIIKECKATASRILFDAKFYFAEYLRVFGKSEEAVFYFKDAYDSAVKNHDYNLSSMCLIGILITELSEDIFFFHDSENAQRESLVEIIDKTRELGLFLNEMTATVTLSFLEDSEYNPSLLQQLEGHRFSREAEFYKNPRRENFRHFRLTAL